MPKCELMHKTPPVPAVPEMSLFLRAWGKERLAGLIPLLDQLLLQSLCQQ
jgi:hypothetical protein